MFVRSPHLGSPQASTMARVAAGTGQPPVGRARGWARGDYPDGSRGGRSEDPAGPPAHCFANAESLNFANAESLSVSDASVELGHTPGADRLNGRDVA